MGTSILRKLLFAFLGFGLVMGIIFPFFASVFVEFKEGYYIWFAILCVLAGLMIGIINYYLLNKLLISKLKHVSEVSQSISNNDLSSTYTLESDDVIGDIVKSFQKTGNTLKQIITNLKADNLKINNTVNQICVVSENTSNGVKNQYTQTQNIQISIENMAQSVQAVSDKAIQAAETADIAKQEASEGQNIVNQTVQSITELANAVESASSSINRLETESMNIGGVLDVIHSISEQTNLLALNAAIEAARAGEQGRGFAVVADEVRLLAQRTKESTKEIQSMIETLQSVSRDTVTIMNAGQDQANESVNHATKAGSSLLAIAGAVQGIAELNQQISEDAIIQSNVANEIKQDIQMVSQIATESIEGTEQTHREGKDLLLLAENLNQQVNKFTI